MNPRAAHKKLWMAPMRHVHRTQSCARTEICQRGLEERRRRTIRKRSSDKKVRATVQIARSVEPIFVLGSSRIRRDQDRCDRKQEGRRVGRGVRGLQFRLENLSGDRTQLRGGQISRRGSSFGHPGYFGFDSKESRQKAKHDAKHNAPSRRQRTEPRLLEVYHWVVWARVHDLIGGGGQDLKF